MKTLPSLLIALALCLGLAPYAKAVEFSADMMQTVQDNQLPPGKAYVKEDRVRTERNMAGHSQIMIMDRAKAKVLMLMPEAKAYMEMRLDPAKMGAAALKDEKSEYGQWRVVGHETVDGWECEKRVFDYKDKPMGELTAWFAEKLGYPVKTVYKGEGGVMIMEYKNIKTGGVDDSLFEVPAGYQKMAMPTMGQGMGQGGMGQAKKAGM